MEKIGKLLFGGLLAMVLSGCAKDDDSFSPNPNNLLTFVSDTIRIDTVFTTIGSSTTNFWVYNKSASGIRISSIRLNSGNQSGFRVNVDGTYLSPEAGYRMIDLDVRKGDSIRIFVEITAPKNKTNFYTTVEDDLIFTYENDNTQRLKLQAVSINADKMHNVVVTKDSTISGTLPIIVYGGIEVQKGAKLTIASGTKLYFHDGAGISVHGSLVAKGTSDNFIVFRGDRLDRMFDYLPYDNISAQWEGIHFYEESYNNIIQNADIHGAKDAIYCDSADASKPKIEIENTIIHNNAGYGVYLCNCYADIYNCQITNNEANCLYVCGGEVFVNNCTIAQFYPFVALPGYAMMFTNTNSDISYPLKDLTVYNTIITGSKEDEVLGDGNDKSDYKFTFASCLIKTPRTTAIKDSVIYEGETGIEASFKNFKRVDNDSIRYDFHLDSISRAVGTADPKKILPYDLNGKKRNPEAPSMGCYEF